MDKASIDVIICIINSIIKLVESLDPAIAQNKVVVDLQKAIETIQALGL